MKTESIDFVSTQQPKSDITSTSTVPAGTTAVAMTARVQFPVIDLFKMLVAAFLSGLVFSSIAAGLTLLLMNHAEAQGTNNPNRDAATSYDTAKRSAKLAVKPQTIPIAAREPGVLNVGDGCELVPIEALDRDWRIRIYGGVDHDIAEIRVMQSFAIPAAAREVDADLNRRPSEGAIVASFHALLPEDAALSSFRVDAAASVAPQMAKLVTHDAFASMSHAAMRALRKSNRLVVLTNGRRIESASILNLKSGDTATVEYTYTVPIETFTGTGLFGLDLVLQSETQGSPTPSRITTTTGTVWVEWINAHPTQAASNATDIFIERVTDGANGAQVGEVLGASWFSPDLSVARKFTLTWNRLQSVASAGNANATSSRVAMASR